MTNTIRVLLVDDDETTNFMNRRTLLSLDANLEIYIKENGKQALELLGEIHQEENLPLDLLLVDIKMSVMGGFQFLEKYQQLPPLQKAKRLFVLSSSASFYDLVKLKEYKDVIAHIDKPLTVHTAKSLIQSIISSKVN